MTPETPWDDAFLLSIGFAHRGAGFCYRGGGQYVSVYPMHRGATFWGVSGQFLPTPLHPTTRAGVLDLLARVCSGLGPDPAPDADPPPPAADAFLHCAFCGLPASPFRHLVGGVLGDRRRSKALLLPGCSRCFVESDANAELRDHFHRALSTDARLFPRPAPSRDRELLAGWDDEWH